MERLDIKRQIKSFKESCSVKRLKVPSTVSKATGLAYELVTQVCKSSTQVANDGTPMTILLVENKVSLLVATSEKAREEGNGASVKLHPLCATVELPSKKHDVASAKVSKELQGNVKACKVMTL